MIKVALGRLTTHSAAVLSCLLVYDLFFIVIQVWYAVSECFFVFSTYVAFVSNHYTNHLS